MSDELIEVTVGRVPLKVPAVIDVATTLRVAEEVNARLKEVEGRGGRIDTYAFSLLTAMSFAAELEKTRRTLAAERKENAREREQETRDLLAVLTTIREGLRAILEKAQETIAE